MLVSDGTVAAFRRIAASAMPDTAQIERLTAVSDGMGGSTETWAVVATYACRLSRLPQMPIERELEDALQGRVPFTLYLPFDADATAADRVVCLGDRFEVVGVHNPTSYQVHVRCTLARLAAEGQVALVA